MDSRADSQGNLYLSSIGAPLPEDRLLLYPNPAKGLLHNEGVSSEVIVCQDVSATGLSHTLRDNGGGTIETSTPPPGVYITDLTTPYGAWRGKSVVDSGQ